MICWMDQKSFTRLTLTPDYRTTSEIQRAQGLLEEVLPTIPDAELLYGVFYNEMMAGINEYPLEYRRVIYKRIEAATGESAEKIKKAYFKKLEKILERGVIKDREEYELVHSRIDELVHNTPEDDPARKDLPELERIFMNYAIGE